jgi:arginyl-tRNA synthetase
LETILAKKKDLCYNKKLLKEKTCPYYCKSWIKMISQELLICLKKRLPEVIGSKALFSEILESKGRDTWKESWDLCWEQIYFVPPPPDKEGHYATNGPFILGKYLKTSPQGVAQIFIEILLEHSQVEKAVFSAPGFINVTLKKDYWWQQFKDILHLGDHFGRLQDRQPKKINVEFVSVNPTGPLHPGHGRSAIFGDVVSNLLSWIGHNVTREYYINDAGRQAELLGRSVYWYYNASPQKGALPKDYYQGEYIQEIATKLEAVYGDGLQEKTDSEKDFWLDRVITFAIHHCMAWIKEDLHGLDIHHDVFSSEKSIQDSGLIEKVVELLRSKDLVYEGFLEDPKDYKKPDDDDGASENCEGSLAEQRQSLLIFRSTVFGDDQDRPLTKRDGSWTYFAGDAAYHLDKMNRGFDEMIDVWGADHGSHVQRIQGVLKALTGNNVCLRVPLCQMVRFKAQESLIKMSKRSGNFITLREVVQAVGKDCFRFFMLTKKLDAHMDFDFQKVQEQTKENPFFYIQYAHARCCSVIRSASEIFGNKVVEQILEKPLENDMLELVEKEDWALVEVLCDFPRQVYSSARALEPHRIATYLHDVASAFHSHWTKGSGKETLRFLWPQDQKRSAKGVALVGATRQILRSGLWILGVDPLKELKAS